jgi:hypothetical protein
MKLVTSSLDFLPALIDLNRVVTPRDKAAVEQFSRDA